MRKLHTLVLASPILMFLTVFFYLPLFSVISLSTQNSVNEWLSQLQHPLFLRFFLFTLSQSIFTLFFSSVFGIMAGYILSTYDIHFQNLVRVLITLPFIFPPLALILGVIIVFSAKGQLQFLGFNPFSYEGIVFIHSLYNISVIARISESAFQSVPQSLHDIADMLGASRIRRFYTITLPHIKPQIEAAIMLVFLYAFNSFAITLVLGEVKLQTIEVMIYSESRVSQNYKTSSILVTFQLLVNLLIILLYTTRKYSPVSVSDWKKTKNSKRLWTTAILYLLILLSWSPVFGLLHFILRNPSQLHDVPFFDTSFNRYLGTSPLRVIINTLFFGLLVASLATVLSFLLIAILDRHRSSSKINRVITLLTLLPMATSAISLSFATLQIYGSAASFTRFVWIFIISAQLLAALPFASRALISGWSRIPPDLLLVSRTLGASWAMNFERVILPLLKTTILVTVIFSFAISVGEFGATYYLSRGEWVTLSIAIYKLLGTRNLLIPTFYALILILTTALLFYVIERMGDLELRV